MTKNKIYSNDIVAIQNKVNAVYKGFTLDEKRLFVIATPQARVIKPNEYEPIFVSVHEFARETGLSNKKAYEALKQATDRLFERHFRIKTEKKTARIRWCWKTEYIDGGANLYFTPDVLEVLSKLDKDNPFTKYAKETVLELRGDYTLDLYHLAKKHENMGKKYNKSASFEISKTDFFEFLDIPEAYKTRMNNLTARVIEPAVKEVNAKTDLTLTYEKIRHGRKIWGFKFNIKSKEKPKGKAVDERDKNTVDWVSGMTDKQIDYFGSLLAHDAIFNGKVIAPTGMSMQDWEISIKTKLREPENQTAWSDDLKRLGFEVK